MDLFIKAEAGDLLWVVVGIFWLIAQVAGAAAKKKRATPRTPARPTDKPPSDPFSDLMKKLSGIEEFKIPSAPEFQEEPAEILSVKRPHTDEPSAQPQPIRPATKTSYQPGRTVLPASTSSAKSVSDRSDVEPLPTMNAFNNAMPAMKLPSMSLRFHASKTSADPSSALQKILQPEDKQSLRRAMLSHIIFSPPKAFEEIK